MAEFLIKRDDNIHSDPAQDRMCYKRGDIIDVFHDGETLNKPWLTVLNVPGLDHQQYKYLCEIRFEPAVKEETFLKGAWDVEKNKSYQVKSNHKDYTTVAAQFLTAPTVISDDGFFITAQAQKLCPHERRRFFIPPDLMDAWFPANVYTKIILLTDFKKLVEDELLDKSFGKIKVKSAPWRSASII